MLLSLRYYSSFKKCLKCIFLLFREGSNYSLEMRRSLLFFSSIIVICVNKKRKISFSQKFKVVVQFLKFVAGGQDKLNLYFDLKS